MICSTVEDAFSSFTLNTNYMNYVVILVYHLDVLSCSTLLVKIPSDFLPTRGYTQLQSVKREQTDCNTFQIVKVGLLLSLRMSRQLTP